MTDDRICASKRGCRVMDRSSCWDSFGVIGWAPGTSLALALQRTARVEEVIVACVVVALAAWALSRFIQRRRR